MPIPSAFLRIRNFARANFLDTIIAAYAFVRRLATVREGAIRERTALHQSLSGVAVFFVVLY
jgi:hypothetical protein